MGNILARIAKVYTYYIMKHALLYNICFMRILLGKCSYH